jgi:hypothetical protein
MVVKLLPLMPSTGGVIMHFTLPPPLTLPSKEAAPLSSAPQLGMMMDREKK